MYYIGQEIIITRDSRKFIAGDKIIIHRMDSNFLYDENNKWVHKNYTAPSFTAGDMVWDTHSNTTFVIYQIVDDQVHSITPVGSTDPSFLRGRPISRVRSLPITAAPATPHPDTERLDWLLSRLSMVTREDIDRLRGKVDENGCYTREDGECVSSGQCIHSQKDNAEWNEAIQKCAEAVELYAISYMTMSKMGDGKVSASDVAYDLRNNVIARNFAALKGARK